MSGIELAGLIIGAVPVLVSLAEASRSGYHKTLVPLRKRRYVAKLADALLLHSRTVTETIRLLIVHSSGAYDGERFESEPVKYLEDEDVQDDILDFLGEKNHAALISTLQNINHVLEKVAKQLSEMIPEFKNPSSDLLGLIKANRDAKPQQFDFVPRMKLMFSYSDLKTNIEDLDGARDSLVRFSKLLLMNRSAASAVSASHKPIRLAKALRRIRLFATDLYHALSRCCEGGVCRNRHEANVLLEDRVDIADELLRLSRQQGKENTSMMVFQVLFAAAPFKAWWHELPIRILKPHDHDDDTCVTSPARTVRVSTPQIVAPVMPDAGLTLVDDFCAAIHAARQANNHVAFVLSGARRMSTMDTQEKTILYQDQAKRITLQEVLSDPVSMPLGVVFSMKLRMLLALRLASSLLQLSQTQWLSHAWSKETIYFLVHPGGPDRKASVDFSRAFVSAAIDGPDASTCTASGPGPEPKVVLLELGILLLEIWHQQTLEAQFDLQEAPTGYYMRLARALEWLEDPSNPPQDLYDSAVSYCIKGNMGGQVRMGGWETNELWNGVCKDIIEPLSKNCSQWR